MAAAKQDNQGKSYDAEWENLDPREQDYRDALGDGLEIVLGAGADTLAAVAEGQNAHNDHGPKREPRTEELLEAELDRVARINGDCEHGREGGNMADLNRSQYSSVEEILETGVLDTWYLVARDSEIDTGPVGLTRLSRDIVL